MGESRPRDANQDLSLGQYCVVRENNFDAVIKVTHGLYSKDDLALILERAAEYGLDRVRIPLIPRHML